MRLGFFSGLVFAVTVAAATALLSTSAFAGKRVALVIGNSDYQKVKKLTNPANDAIAVGEIFRAAGFDVVDIRHDLGAQSLRRTLRDFSLVTREADVAVVFYAGHGIEVDGNNYLVPIDAKLEWDVDVEDETVSLDRVLKVTETAKRFRLIILDACRDNVFATFMKRTVATRSIGRGLAKVDRMSSDTLIAFAAKAGSMAEDGTGPNSPFTSALLKHLAVPGLDVRFAFGRVRDEVWRSTAYKQEPAIYGSLGGDVISIVPAAPEPPRARVLAPDELTWDFLKDSSDAAALKQFVERFPTSAFRGPAEARIAALAAKSAPPAGPQEANRAAPPEIDRRELARALQLELKRVGCFEGAVDGEFGSTTRVALRNFARFAAVTVPEEDPSIDAIKSVRGFDKRVCPVVCQSGERVEGERCIRIVCPPGQVLKDGNCVGKVASDPKKVDSRPSRASGTATTGQQQMLPVSGSTVL